MTWQTGIIVLWSGVVLDIPDGWTLCDGNNGTPDLRDSFVLGASVPSPPGATGGSLTHTHTGTTNGHSHSITGPPDYWQQGLGYDNQTGTSTDTFTTQPANNLPPYYALAYIMKL